MEYRIVRSSRKTIAIEVKLNGEVLVRCPRRMAAEAVHAFVRSKQRWIEKQLQRIPVTNEPTFTAEELEALREKTRDLVTARSTYFAPLVGVNCNRIAVRIQHTRWGSCSSKGNLNFNCLLCLLPPEVADYVVVHELCHRKHMNHSPLFWAEVERVLPDYRELRKWLKEKGRSIISRLDNKTE